MTEVVFYIFAVAAVLSATLCILQKNPVSAALWLVSTMFSLAAIYVLLNAQFIAAIQVLVYAGAVMVLFLFVIMLLGVDRIEDVRELRLIAQRPVAIVLGVGFVAEVFFAVRTAIGFSRHVPAGFDAINKGGNAQAIARVLFRKYFFPFEVTSILLIIAAIAAMVLAQRKAPAITQAEMDARAADRVHTGSEATL